MSLCPFLLYNKHFVDINLITIVELFIVTSSTGKSIGYNEDNCNMNSPGNKYPI
jgi:hypothetical protein